MRAGFKTALPWLILATLLTVVGLLLLAPFIGNRRSVSGTVLGPKGPAEGVRVRFKGQRTHSITDAEGRFSLPGRDGRLTAWLEGYLIAGVDGSGDPLTLQLKPLPAEDCERYEWVDPTPDAARPRNCGNCHGEIYQEWRGSGHAGSATGKHFRNLFDGSDWQGRPDRGWSLLADHPDGAGVCTACHAPTVASVTDAAYFDLRRVEGVAAQGVHCDYCHKVTGTAGDIGTTHGRFGLTLLRPSEGQLFFGPLDDVDRGEDAHLPLYKQSRYCAPCHEGTVFGVHVYGTYSEWLDSPARRQGLQCQGCHTTPTGRMTNIAPGHGGIERDPQTLGNHRFFSGSLTEMLQKCLKLGVEGNRKDDAVEAVVSVEARDVGHRVPTGFVDRSLAVVVEPLGTDGGPLTVLAGPRLPAWAGTDIRGKPGKLYAKTLKDFDGRRPVPFWRADPAADDTRLVPGSTDRLIFRFPPEARTVRVRLLYRRFWPDVAAVKGWPDNEIPVAEQTFPLFPPSR